MVVSPSTRRRERTRQDEHLPTAADQADPGTSHSSGPTNTGTPRRRGGVWRTGLRIGVALVGLGVMVLALRGRIPSRTDVIAALTGARGGWLLAAVAMQAVSVSMFARQQQRLLTAFGVNIGIRRLLAITYARSAISISLPAGSAVSAGFAFGQFRARGATSRTAATVTILSGVVSTATLGLLAAAASVGVLPNRDRVGAALATAALIAVGAGVAWWRRRRGRQDAGPQHAGRQDAGPQHDGPQHDGPREPEPQRWSIPVGRPGLAGRWRTVCRGIEAVREAITEAADVRTVDWIVAAAFAALNWTTDLLCLYAATRAVGLTLPVSAVAVGYLAVQVVRQVPLTPGGIGIVEASLLLALVSTGATHAPAAAAVLIYRILSCWAIVAVGLATWTVLQAASDRPGEAPAEVSAVDDVPSQRAPGSQVTPRNNRHSWRTRIR